MTVQKLAEQFRVAARRDACGDHCVPGKNGHLWCEGGQVFVCFTDDGRKRPLTKVSKTLALSKLAGAIVTQEGDAEFVARITEAQIPVALRILGVKRLRRDAGVSRPFRKTGSSRGSK